MASIFDMFKQQTPAPTATPAASAATNPTVPGATNTPAANPTPGTVSGTDTNNTGAASPLDQYKNLWETDPNAKKEIPFSFNSDPAKLMDTAKTVDFTKVVTPQTMELIAKGGPEAQKAMIESMNAMSQMSFAQSANAAAKIAEAALQQQEERFKAMLPQLIKQHTVVDNLKQTNPLMSDPAMAPLIGALQQQFTSKFPNATAVQINDHVNEFLNGAADRITGQRPVKQDPAKRQEMDWSKFVE